MSEVRSGCFAATWSANSLFLAEIWRPPALDLDEQTDRLKQLTSDILGDVSHTGDGVPPSGRQVPR